MGDPIAKSSPTLNPNKGGFLLRTMSFNGSGRTSKDLNRPETPIPTIFAKSNSKAQLPFEIDSYDTKHEDLYIAYQDEFDLWKLVEEPLKTRLVLKDVSLKTSRGSSAQKNLSELNLRFLPYSHQIFNYTSSPLNWYLKPFLYIFFIQGEENEQYKKDFRPVLKQFATVMNERGQEWLVLHVSTVQKTARTELSSKLQRTVFDKIKSDLPKDRAFQLRLAEEKEKVDQQWDELVARIRAGVVHTIEQNIMNYEEEIRKVDSKRLLKGWSFPNFFLLKEGLAFTYERVNMLDEALRQYVELEALFMENSDSNNNKKFEKFGGSETGDDANCILSTRSKPYRSLLLSSTISEFDFRIYLFARQAKLHFALSHPVQVARNAITFIQMLSKDIQKAQQSLPKHFRECWIYSASLDVIKACESYISQPPTSDGTNQQLDLSELHFLLGDLYYNARKKLDILGETYHLLPDISEEAKVVRHPFLSAQNGVHSPVNSVSAEQLEQEKIERSWITNPQLRQVLESESQFDVLFLELTSKATNHYKNSNRTRNVLQLNRQIGALYFRRGLHSQAESLLKSVSNLYFTEGWFKLAFHIRTQLAECQRHLKHDVEYITSCLGLLSPEMQLTTEEKEFYLADLIEVARKALSSVVMRDVHPLLHCSLHFEGNMFPLGSHIKISAHLRSLFPKEVLVDKLLLKLSVSESNDTSMLFEIKNAIIPPGESVFTFESQANVIGNFGVDKLTVDIGYLVLSLPLRIEYEKILLKITSSSPAAKIIPSCSDFLIVSVIQTLRLRIEANGDEILSSKLTLSPSSAAVSFIENMPMSLIRTSASGEQLDPISVVIKGGECIPFNYADRSNSVGPLPGAHKGEVWLLDVPIQATSDALGGSESATFSFTYEKFTKEVFEIKETHKFLFGHPFTLIPNQTTLQDRLLIQVLMECHIPTPVQVLDCRLIPEQGFIEHSPLICTLNAGKPLPVRWQQHVSAFFVISDKLEDLSSASGLNDIPATSKLQVKFTSPLKDLNIPNLPDSFMFESVFNLRIPQVFHTVDISCPVEAPMGSLIPFQFSISLKARNKSFDKECSQTINYEVTADPSLWILAGHDIDSFNIKLGETKTLDFRILALKAGFLPVPQLQMSIKDGSRTRPVIYSPPAKQIFIFPSKTVLSPLNIVHS